MLALLALLAAAVPGAAARPGPAGSGAGPKAAVPGDTVPGRYIVVYAPSVRDVDAATNARERARGFRSRLRFRHALKGFSARLSDRQAERLRADPGVRWVVPDRTVSASGSVPLASGEPVPPTGVRRIGAATTTTARQAANGAVAVIDTGIDLSHPDLNAVSGTNCINRGASAQDDDGHGTHVAGTIAARNNGTGVVGVAPGTRLYAVKVLDSTGSGSSSSVICGIDWVTANSQSLGIRVANMSLGGPGKNDRNCGLDDGDPLHQAICRSTSAGVLHVVAAGNSGWDLGDHPPDTPAAFPEVLTVTAMTDSDGSGGAAGPAPACDIGAEDDAYASFSNYATRDADKQHMIAAPGACITSTRLGGGTEVMSGTSMAAPHVAGAVALCLGEGGAAGPCTGKAPAQLIAHMRGDAETRTLGDAAHSFAGDPLNPNELGHYFGYLARVRVDTSLSGGPSGTTNSRVAHFSFTAGESGATFECKLDADAWSACTTSVSYSDIPEGSHSFSVRATDIAGSSDPTPATRTWIVDTTPPDTSITEGPASLTNDSTPTFELAATESGSSFQCRVGNGTWSPCTSPHTTAALSDGAHTFWVRARDAAGNEDATPAARTFAVATSTPAVTTPSPGAGGAVNDTAPADTAPPELALRVRKAMRLRRALRRGVRVVTRCSEPCSVRARLKVGGRASKRLGLARRRRARVIGRRSIALVEGRRAFRVKIRRRVRKRLRHAESFRVRLRVVVVDAAGNRTAKTRRVTLRA